MHRKMSNFSSGRIRFKACIYEMLLKKEKRITYSAKEARIDFCQVIKKKNDDPVNHLASGFHFIWTRVSNSSVTYEKKYDI